MSSLTPTPTGLFLTDAATGRRVRMSRRGGLWRVAVRPDAVTGPGDVTDLRVLLVADLVARGLELRSSQVIVTVFGGDGSSAQSAALTRAADLLGVHPASGSADATAGATYDVTVIGPLGAPTTTSGEVRVQAGAATLPLPLPLPEFAESAGVDPLAVRLAMLARPHSEPLVLSESDCRNAAATLDRWRRLTAEGADRPSRPIPGEVRRRSDACLDDDLDVGGLIALLAEVENDPAVPPGARFETFAYLDRILGLDLARRVGR